MTVAEQIYEVAKTLPTNQAEEVLDFIYFLKTKSENVEEILQIGRDCAALPDIDTRTPDEILGYDQSPIGLWDNKYGA